MSLEPILVQGPPQLYCPVCKEAGRVNKLVIIGMNCSCQQNYCGYKAEVPPAMLAQIENRPRLPGV